MNPNDPLLTACILRGHLKLISLGMKHSKLSNQQILDAVGKLTGKEYSSRSKNAIANARKDIKDYILNEKQQRGLPFSHEKD